MIKGIPINGLDLAVGIILLISALLAFIRGFVHEVLSIVAWAGALAAATYGLPYARPFAHKIIPFGWAADAAAAVVIFLAVLLILSMISHAIAARIQKSALNNVDRSLGFLFGLARAVVILGVGLLVVDWMTERNRPDWVRTAKTLPIIESAANTIKTLVPSSFMAPSEGSAAKDALRKTEVTDTRGDARKTFDRLTTPATSDGKGGDGKGESKARETGYQNKERQDMEHLLQSTDTAPAVQSPSANPSSMSPPHE